MHRSPLALTVALTLGLSSPASAQDDFSRLKVKLGQIVYVTDASTGVEVSGPLTSVTPRDLSIDGYRFQPKPGLKIERAGDSVWDGAALGFGVGLLYGGALVLPECFAPRSRTGCLLGPAIGFAAIGALIDYATVGRTTIYEGAGPSTRTNALGRSSLRIMPEVDAHRKAIAMAIRF